KAIKRHHPVHQDFAVHDANLTRFGKERRRGVGDSLPPGVPRWVQKVSVAHRRVHLADVLVAVGIDLDEALDKGGIEEWARCYVIRYVDEPVRYRVPLGMGQARA